MAAIEAVSIAVQIFVAKDREFVLQNVGDELAIIRRIESDLHKFDYD
jgi:hypothetical protein